MTTAIIITVCTLLLLAYIFDLTSAKTKVPSVILLLILGFIVRKTTQFLGIVVPDLSSLLPIFGTVGLILIVLEGALELEYHKSKKPLIIKSAIASILPMIAMMAIVSCMFQYFGNIPLKNSLINAIPLCIISSAIAIPSVKSLIPYNREFVIYESSFSDIIGVLFFNFVALNDSFGIYTFGIFGLQVFSIMIISCLATLGLAFLLNKIDHHIKFGPIIFLVILIYTIAKIYHLPCLIFILFLGLFLGNLEELKIFKWMEKLKPDDLGKEVAKFKDLTSEGTFLIRSLFFLLFGYTMQASEILNTDTLDWAIAIVVIMFVLRAIQLKLLKLPLSPLLFISPRGLITILLFLAIPASQNIPMVNKSLIIQIVILTALVMMFGLFTNKNHKEEKTEEPLQ